MHRGSNRGTELSKMHKEHLKEVVPADDPQNTFQGTDKQNPWMQSSLSSHGQKSRQKEL